MTKHVVEVVAGILWRKGKYLAAQRPAASLHGGCWEFPGGKVEAGESLTQALGRELREELGVEVQRADFWKTVEHSYDQRHVRVHFFHVHDFLGEPEAAEGQGLAWLLPQEGVCKNFLEADKNLVQELVSKTFP